MGRILSRAGAATRTVIAEGLGRDLSILLAIIATAIAKTASAVRAIASIPGMS
jgi:hypothetical protein